jgi:hypothetical protein
VHLNNIENKWRKNMFNKIFLSLLIFFSISFNVLAGTPNIGTTFKTINQSECWKVAAKAMNNAGFKLDSQGNYYIFGNKGQYRGLIECRNKLAVFVVAGPSKKTCDNTKYALRGWVNYLAK